MGKAGASSAVTGLFLGFVSVAALPACGKTNEPKAATAEASPSPASAATGVTGKAAVGKPAPDFTLTDTEGKTFHLADHKGKVVVLEWFNPECPFVKKSHEKGSLKTFANAKTSAGVVWVAVNSSAVGKQGHEPARNAAAKKEWALSHPILLDSKSEVGRAYGATNTPQMFVIDAQGTLVYGGAIDNSPDGEGESPTPPGNKLVNYVEQALGEVGGGKPVSVATTKAYGCSVKY